MFHIIVYIKIPSNAVAIKDYKISIGKVGAIFERIAKRHGDFEKVFVHCLQTLYNRIVYMSKFSSLPSVNASHDENSN